MCARVAHDLNVGKTHKKPIGLVLVSCCGVAVVLVGTRAPTGLLSIAHLFKHVARAVGHRR